MTGDVVLLLSASGRSENVLAAAERARALGLTVWAMTGPAPNPLAGLADDAICVAGADTAVVQEVHLVAIHALCDALDARDLGGDGPMSTAGPLVVVGDALLDCDVDGQVSRLCPDAPAPVLEDAVPAWRPGGAALAALLAAPRKSRWSWSRRSATTRPAPPSGRCSSRT